MQRDVEGELGELDRKYQEELKALDAKYEALRHGVLEGATASATTGHGEERDARGRSRGGARGGRTRGSDRGGRGRGDVDAGRSKKREDWNCLKCGDHQFARNRQCRKCGTPQPTELEVQIHIEKQLEEKKKRECLEQKRREEVEHERRAKEESKLARIASISRHTDPDCWGATYVIKYFEDSIKAGIADPDLYVTTMDDDWAGLKDTPLNEAGFKMQFFPAASSERRYVVSNWRNYDGNVTESQNCAWTEAEMLYYTSEDAFWHATFAEVMFSNSPSEMLKK